MRKNLGEKKKKKMLTVLPIHYKLINYKEWVTTKIAKLKDYPTNYEL